MGKDWQKNFTFKIANETGNVVINIKHPADKKALFTVIEKSIIMLDPEHEEMLYELDEYEEPDDDDEDDDTDPDSDDDEPNIKNFPSQTLEEKYPDDKQFRFKFIHFNPTKSAEIIELLFSSLDLHTEECESLLLNKIECPLIDLDVANKLFNELKQLGVLISIKAPSQDTKTLFTKSDFDGKLEDILSNQEEQDQANQETFGFTPHNTDDEDEEELDSKIEDLLDEDKKGSSIEERKKTWGVKSSS